MIVESREFESGPQRVTVTLVEDVLKQTPIVVVEYWHAEEPEQAWDAARQAFEALTHALTNTPDDAP